MNKVITEIEKSLSDVQLELVILASAFAATGNREVSENLYNQAQVITVACSKLTKTLADEANKRYQEAQQASANILNTALAMAEKQKSP